MLLCAPAAVVPLEACSPDVSRQRVRAKRLPAVGAAFFHGHHEAVVRQRVAVGIRQQKPSSGRAVDELEHGYGGAVWQLLMPSRY